MAPKKSIIKPVRLSRSGKYSFIFMDGIMERWELAKQQASMNFQLDMKNQEVRMKLYRERLEYLDGKLDSLKKERRGMEASELSNQQKVSNANVTIGNQQQTWNKGQVATVELATARGTATPGSAGTSRGSGATTKTTDVVDLISKFGNADILQEQGDSVRNAVTDEQFVNVGRTAVHGAEYVANTAPIVKQAGEANVYLQQKSKIITDASDQGNAITPAMAEAKLAAIYENQGKTEVLNRMKNSWEALQSTTTTTAGTGGVTGRRAGRFKAPTPQQVSLDKQTVIDTDYENIDKAIADTITEREALQAPGLTSGFDLIGDTRQIYGDKFGRGSKEQAKTDIRKLLEVGELYGQEAMQSAMSKLDWRTQEQIRDKAIEAYSGSGDSAPYAPEDPGLADLDVVAQGAVGQTDAKIAEEKPEDVTATPALVNAQKISQVIQKSQAQFRLMMPTQADSQSSRASKIDSIRKWYKSIEGSDPEGFEHKVFTAYEKAKASGGDVATSIELMKKMFPNKQDEATALAWQLFELGRYVN